MGDGCCTSFARLILVAFNILFVLSGAGVLGVGIFLKVDPDSKHLQQLISVDSTDKYISSTAYVLIGFGTFVFLVGILGCLGGMKQWKWALSLYIVFLVIIFLGEFSGGIMAAVFKSKVEDKLKSTLDSSLKEYSSKQQNSITDIAWNEVQQKLKCCGVTNYRDYVTLNVTGFDSTQPIPDSCCHGGKIPKCHDEANNSTSGKIQYLYTEGCLNTVMDQLKNNLTILIGVGIGIAMIQLLGILLACKSCRSDDFGNQSV